MFNNKNFSKNERNLNLQIITFLLVKNLNFNSKNFNDSIN